MKPLITDAQMEELLANGARKARRENTDPMPVVKLFTPDANATWLISEADPENPDLLYGLCDLGFGHPEFGYITLSEIAAVRGPLGFPVEPVPGFEPEFPISVYAVLARHTC